MVKGQLPLVLCVKAWHSTMLLAASPQSRHPGIKENGTGLQGCGMFSWPDFPRQGEREALPSMQSDTCCCGSSTVPSLLRVVAQAKPQAQALSLAFEIMLEQKYTSH